MTRRSKLVWSVSCVLMSAAMTSSALAADGGPLDVGDLVVTAYLDDRVMQFDDSGAFQGVFLGETPYVRTGHVVFTADGRYMLVTRDEHPGSGVVEKYNATTGEYLGDLLPLEVFDEAGWNGPTQLAFGPDGSLFVGLEAIDPGDPNAVCVLECDVETGSCQAAIMGIPWAWGLAVASNGNLFVCEYDAGAVHEYTRDAGSWLPVGSPITDDELIQPHGVTVGRTGHLYVASCGNDSIIEFEFDDVRSEWQKTRRLSCDALDDPLYLAIGPHGSLFVASSTSDCVIEFDLNTGVGHPFAVGIDYAVGLAFKPPTIGDMNCDGEVAFGDINAFVVAMNGYDSYHAAYPDCRYENADCNGDGYVDFGDINAFVSLLGG